MEKIGEKASQKGDRSLYSQPGTAHPPQPHPKGILDAGMSIVSFLEESTRCRFVDYTVALITGTQGGFHSESNPYNLPGPSIT